GIPYSKIITVSIIPALLYFFSLMIIVHLEGSKIEFKKELMEESVRKAKIKTLLKDGWFYFIPLALLFVFLFLGYS
ncbi:MAG TPA: C4-dicarboxylate ABC transporter permease, partial [Clostridiales bacterium]|nr:C4-dicarboxylate ABC transporter permease [Clostridiales bacterium]